MNTSAGAASDCERLSVWKVFHCHAETTWAAWHSMFHVGGGRGWRGTHQQERSPSQTWQGAAAGASPHCPRTSRLISAAVRGCAGCLPPPPPRAPSPLLSWLLPKDPQQCHRLPHRSACTQYPGQRGISDVTMVRVNLKETASCHRRTALGSLRQGHLGPTYQARSLHA